MHIFKKLVIENKKNIEQKLMRNRMFFRTSILKDLERVRAGFWEAKLLDFRSCFDGFCERDMNVRFSEGKMRNGLLPEGGVPAPTREKFTEPGPPTRVFLIFI